jgi:hypothetical protein
VTDDLRSLAHDLSEAPRKAQRDAVGVVQHGAVNVKKRWADNARQSSGTHAPAYPNSISYDLDLGAALTGRVEAVIGPDKSKRQGALGNILEFGSPHSAPHNDGGRALRSEAGQFEAELAKVALDALGWH